MSCRADIQSAIPVDTDFGNLIFDHKTGPTEEDQSVQYS